MILGIGVDLVATQRIARLLERYPRRFPEMIFTEEERAYAFRKSRPEEPFAARFAAKEALLKAFSVPRGLRWHELAVVSDAGRPIVSLTGRAAEIAEERGVSKVHLSLSHGDGYAIAMVVLESGG